MPWNRLSILAILLAAVRNISGAPIEFNSGDHVCLIGNSLAERMQHHGWLETLVHSRLPDRKLVFRTLAFPGDELTLRLRSQDFGSPDKHLTASRADVILLFFGYNESFGGKPGLEKFKADLDGQLKHLLAQRYNGASAPRLVVFSPIAQEDPRGRDLPDAAGTNRNIQLYTEAMAEVCTAGQTAFLDLFTASRRLYENSRQPLTINGIHLNEYGDRQIAGAIEALLFPGSQGPQRDAAYLEKLRASVLDKNFHWFNRYRTVDGFSIFGGRADLKFVAGQTNRDVMQREMEILDVMTANRDRRIWETAQGKEFSVDDGNTPPFIPVTTNLPGAGKDGAHIFASGEESIARMQVHPGMKVNLFASEEMFPDLAKAVQMAFDVKNRLWVAAMPSYPHWKPKDVMDDKVLILEDRDGDGRADTSKIFARGLHVPTGLEFYNGGLLLAQAPDLMFLKDTDGDDVADVRERVVGGLDSADTHHQMNSFTLDPGGALYFQEGTFHHTQVESVYGPPRRCANAGVFRYEPRAQKFEVYVTYPFANPHGHVFDYWGQDFVTDGTGNVNYYATAFSGQLDYPRKHPDMEPFFQQRIRPCAGTEILSSRHFPDELQGNYLDANVIGFHGILQYKISDKDSGFGGVEIDSIVQSSDTNFRPVDIEIGPDGAIYFLDWQNPIIGHMQHNLRDPSRDQKHGRIYRITYPGRPLLKPPAIAGAPIRDLLELLKEPENRLRTRVKTELGARPTAEVLAALERWIPSLDPKDGAYEHHLLEALWVHQHHNTINEPLLRRMLQSPDYRARAAATRVLCYWRDRVSEPLRLLRTQAEDDYPRVRLEAVRAASFFREPAAVDAALAILKRSMDYYLGYTLKETLTQLEPFWKKAVSEGAPISAGNPAGMEYLLQKASTAELLRMPPSPLTYQALLSRADVVHENRHAALMGLARANGTDVLAELLAAMHRMDAADTDQSRTVLHDLAHMLTTLPAPEIRKARGPIAALAASGRQPFTRQIAGVALITADADVGPAWQDAQRSIPAFLDILNAIPLIPETALRASAHERLKPFLAGVPAPIESLIAASRTPAGRYVRIELPRRGTLTLAEVEVLSEGTNIARTGSARQSTTSNGGEASKAIDGNTSGAFGDKGQTHSRENEDNPWWELDLGSERAIEAIVVWNRSESGGRFASRLDGFLLTILDAGRQETFRKAKVPAPERSVRIEVSVDASRALRAAALQAIASTGRNGEETFTALAGLVRGGKLREAALRAIARIPSKDWPRAEVKPLIASITEFAAKLPPEERTSAAIRDALQLGNDLAALLPLEEAQAARRALREIGVPTIVIRPVPHLMVYDRPRIYVEAGKPVEIVFENSDIMPHNLVITRPKALVKVGMEAEKMAADPNGFAKNFVPDMPEVLHSIRLLQPQQSGKLNFTAPAELDEYPFVCTFPGHWRRMYGTMFVVRSLDDVPPEALVAPPAPQEATRPFVKEWKVDDLSGQLVHLDHGRDLERGKKLFAEASCSQCHRVNGAGGEVGPDLLSVMQKLTTGKMALADVLTEMIEPSKVMEDKYRPNVLILADGQIVTGILGEQTEKELQIRTVPSAEGQNTSQVIPLKRIRQRQTSAVSLMPLGLLNTLTEDEILDLMGYILSAK